MPDFTPHTAEEATPRELRRAIVRLALSLAALALLIIPIVHELPLGQTTRTGILAWLLVPLALYWLYAGQGYRPLLLLQVLVFSIAASLLSVKALLVGVGVVRLSILLKAAMGLIVLGGTFAGINLGGMLIALLRDRRTPRGLS
ncbi:MAG: hypothetical protein ABJD11_11780 [Gemmatimonadota bacterium]